MFISSPTYLSVLVVILTLYTCGSTVDNLLKDDEPVWKQDEYTPFGKWMDGWESRRRRTEGHDWCIVELGIAGTIKAVELDTMYFSGNFSPKASVCGIDITSGSSKAKVVQDLLATRAKSIEDRPEFGRMGLAASGNEWELVNQLQSELWEELVPLSPLGAGYEETRRTVFLLEGSSKRITHIRLNMGPDGGISRMRLYGQILPDLSKLSPRTEVDLAFVSLGGLALAWSNKHYGHPRNLIAPGRGLCMGDGWETARQPLRPAKYQKGPDGLMLLPGYDWAVLKLGKWLLLVVDAFSAKLKFSAGVSGTVNHLEIDTHFYKGNYPESCLIEGCYLPTDSWPEDSVRTAINNYEGSDSTKAHGIPWKVILPRTRLEADKRHYFDKAQLQEVGS